MTSRIYSQSEFKNAYRQPTEEEKQQLLHYLQSQLELGKKLQKIGEIQSGYETNISKQMRELSKLEKERQEQEKKFKLIETRICVEAFHETLGIPIPKQNNLDPTAFIKSAEKYIKANAFKIENKRIVVNSFLPFQDYIAENKNVESCNFSGYAKINHTALKTFLHYLQKNKTTSPQTLYFDVALKTSLQTVLDEALKESKSIFSIYFVNKDQCEEYVRSSTPSIHSAQTGQRKDSAPISKPSKNPVDQVQAIKPKKPLPPLPAKTLAPPSQNQEKSSPSLVNPRDPQKLLEMQQKLKGSMTGGKPSYERLLEFLENNQAASIDEGMKYLRKIRINEIKEKYKNRSLGGISFIKIIDEYVDHHPDATIKNILDHLRKRRQELTAQSRDFNKKLAEIPAAEIKKLNEDDYETVKKYIDRKFSQLLISSQYILLPREPIGYKKASVCIIHYLSLNPSASPEETKKHIVDLLKKQSVRICDKIAILD